MAHKKKPHMLEKSSEKAHEGHKMGIKGMKEKPEEKKAKKK